jgi:hypothetical protein
MFKKTSSDEGLGYGRSLVLPSSQGKLTSKMQLTSTAPVLKGPGIEQTIASISQSLSDSTWQTFPYQYCELRRLFPGEVIRDLRAVSLPHFAYNDGYGARNIYNKHRHYFDQKNNQRFQACNAVANAFQSDVIVKKIEQHFDVSLSGSSVRIEYTQDTDGFWLKPHTDIGAKLFTMLIYLSDGPGHQDLGTDIYASPREHVRSCNAEPNAAMAFVPSNNTWHGFEKRPIQGVRKTAILNYVVSDWQARHELAFPDHAVLNGAT